MIDLKDIEGIYLYKGNTDMRMGIFGLSALAQTIIPVNDMRRRLFIFCGKTKKSVKILELDYDGWWLYQKRLINGKYVWPKNMDENTMIDKRQLQWLLDGLSIVQKYAHKEEKITITY